MLTFIFFLQWRWNVMKLFRRAYGGSSSLGVAAAAEAYVADYMRTMQHQLPPLPPYVTPHPYDSLPPPPPPPRYYDGLPLPPDYGSATSSIDKRSYERSVDEFLWRTASRHSRHGDHRSSRDHHHRYRERRWRADEKISLRGKKWGSSSSIVQYINLLN